MPVPPHGSRGGRFSDDLVLQAGRAVAQVQKIRQVYDDRIESAEDADDKSELSRQSEIAAVQAVEEQGLSADQYNAVIQAAERDEELQQALLAAARRE